MHGSTEVEEMRAVVGMGEQQHMAEQQQQQHVAERS